MWWRVMVLVVLLVPWMAIAEEGSTRLVASIASYHFDRGNGYCEVNPGLGLEHEFKKNVQFHVGQYEGSKCRPISYIGASWCPVELYGVRGCLGLIGLIGYNAKDRSELMFAPVPAIKVPIDARRGANIVFFIPHDDFKGGAGLQLTFE